MTLPPSGTILQADVIEGLRALPEASVHCVVTSPPYWGLRDYGEQGQGGLEPTIEAHLAWTVAWARELRRVLRPDGTLWLNYGDCYASGGGAGTQGATGQRADRTHTQESLGVNRNPPGLKPKDLVGMAWRVAFALQADGWWLRSDIIWHKPNPMPESVTDRPTRSHEYLFLLTPSARYFYDADAVREDYAPATVADKRDNGDGARRERQFPGAPSNGGTNLGGQRAGGRNLRSVWTIPTQPYPGAHFATYPERLVQPCIRAGTSERGVCPACGAPWVRQVEATGGTIGNGAWADTARTEGGSWSTPAELRAQQRTYQSHTTGWAPSCACDTGDPEPAWVLDPFAGSGTTGVVAAKLGRRFVGIDLAGGDKDLGGHTAHDRIRAAATGRDLAEHVGLQRAGQQDLLHLAEGGA